MSSTLADRTEKISIRMTSEERMMAESLAKYLKRAGNIEEATISSALRLCLHYTVTEILKAIERRRYYK